MGFILLLLLLSITVDVFARTAHDDIIDYVQGQGSSSTWQAGHNPMTDLDMPTLASMAGSKAQSGKEFIQMPYKIPGSHESRTVLPPSFDPRVQWPDCQSLFEVRDQGRCGSCWSHAGVSALSDRICIASAGQNVYTQLAVQDPLVCYSGGTDNLCNGGYIDAPYRMFVNQGIVTGGGYQSNSGCLPYQSYPASIAATTNSSSCNSTCWNPSFPNSYQQDKFYGTTYYGMGLQFTNGPTGGAGVNIKNESVIKQLQLELMTNGPLTTMMQVYEDLYSYQSGVYQKTTGNYVGGHAIKLLGWGTDNGTDYWLMANSWGNGWGQGGFFKILRGSNHLGVENYLIGGMARQVTTTTGLPTTPTTTPTTTTPMTTPPPTGRPPGYERCDAMFCYQKAVGYYYLSPCSRNYCHCDGNGLSNWTKCDVGSFYDRTSGSCKNQSTTFCPVRTVKPLSNVTYPAAPAFIAGLCNQANCKGRNGEYTWYGLGLCSPYWCYCWMNIATPTQAVQTCPTGQWFDFRTEAARCAAPSELVWCAS